MFVSLTLEIHNSKLQIEVFPSEMIEIMGEAHTIHL